MESFVMKTPIGKICVTTDVDTVVDIQFVRSSKPLRRPQTSFQKDVEKQFKEYFLGRRKDFLLPLKIQGGDFAHRVLKELWHLEFGEIISYSDLALRAGAPKAVRAVASVMASNRLPIVLPCHRVVPRSGGIGHYGGGVQAKKALLQLERASA